MLDFSKAREVESVGKGLSNEVDCKMTEGDDKEPSCAVTMGDDVNILCYCCYCNGHPFCCFSVLFSYIYQKRGDYTYNNKNKHKSKEHTIHLPFKTKHKSKTFYHSGYSSR